MDNGLVIETRELGKRYDGRIVAVDRLSLRVRHGEVYGFLGPNGAGKTTTLRMLLGLVRPTAGSARVLGFAPGSPQALARTGALIESPSFYPFLSGRDNLRVLARHAGVHETQIEPALLKDPELLILDEPTNGMDPAGMAEMRSFIRRLGRGNRTVLLSSHLMTEVEQICDRVGVISRGTLVSEGTVDELRGRESLWLRADPLPAAEQVLRALRHVDGVERIDGGPRVGADVAAAAEINRALVEAGIAVGELRPERASLEEVFLELTEVAA